MGQLKKPLRISYKDFAAEIEKDLDTLLYEYPDGLYAHHLREYYGETPNRIFHALSLLVAQDVVSLCKATDSTYYVIKVGAPIKPLVELTELQRRLVYLVMKTCKEQNTYSLRTDYSQLNRILKASPMGLRACLQRLHVLDYIRIDEPSRIGLNGMMVLSIGSALKKTFEDYHLDS